VSAPRSDSRGWGAWLLGAALALPTLLVRSPPMTDLAMHAGAVGLLLHWGDETYVPRGLYWLNLGHPNQLFYGIAYVFSKVLGLRFGVGLAVALAQAAILGGGARFARHVGAPWWTALWLAPLALGWTYFWGLATNLCGLALFLPAVVLGDRFVTAPTRRRGAEMAGFYVLLFLAHETALGAAVFVHLVLFASLASRSRRLSLAPLAPVLFAVLLVVGHAIALHRIHTAAEQGFVRDVVFGSIAQRVVDLPGVIFGNYPAAVTLMMTGLYGAAAWATRRSADGAPGPRENTALGERFWDRRFVVAGLGLVLAYFVVPSQLFGVTMLNARFAPYAWALLLPACAAGAAATPASARARRLAILLTGAGLVAPLLVAVPAFLDSDRVNRSLDRVIAQMEPGQAVMVERLQPRGADEVFTPVSCGRVLAARGGRCQFDFTRTSVSPVRMTEALMWTRIGQSLSAEEGTVLRPPVDLRYYRYLLLWSDAAARDRPTLERTLGPYARLRADDDGWLLFESTLPRVTPDHAELGRAP
jgi:hypothetical protein